MANKDLNAQARFLDQLSTRSYDAAVEVLKNVHDAKEAARRAAFEHGGSARADGARRWNAGSLLPRLDDYRSLGGLLFDVAQWQVQTLDAALQLRRKHLDRVESRLGGILGFPVSGNRGEWIELHVPVRAVETDRRERAGDGLPPVCELVRQFRAANRTQRDWALPPTPQSIPLQWEDGSSSEPALRVEMIPGASHVPAGSVLPMRLRAWWTPSALDGLTRPVRARGRFDLVANGEIQKSLHLEVSVDPER